MDRLERLDRRARYSVGGALAFLGVLLLVLGWYLISGEAVAARQLPYLASASLPGAVLVVCGFLFAVTGATERDAQAARRVAELHALLTEAVAASGSGSEASEISEAHEIPETPGTLNIPEIPGAGGAGAAEDSGPATLPESPEPPAKA